MGDFKDISEMLAKKYPDRKVFVISDEHFEHKNIINLTRHDLFGSDNTDISLEKMNEYIINAHNSVINDDDIVLILGDFSFKTGIERLTEIVSKLNGHKFLITGNHDKGEKPDIYLRAGFEDVFLTPIKFNGDYYSHYPLNSTSEEDCPNTILYNFLRKEFMDSSSGINFHGHQHIFVDNGPREKNVACELLDYKPLFVGRTKSYQIENNAPFIGEDFFEVVHGVLARFSHLQENSLVVDYLYTIILDLLTEYEDVVAFGSIMLNKKFGTSFVPSDLDVTKVFDGSKSVRANRDSFKKFGNEIYQNLIQLHGINADYYKKIDFICILSFIYASKNGNFKGYLDMNMLLDDFYKSSDFVRVTGSSLLELYANKGGVEIPDSIQCPKFNIQTTTAMADVVNCFLQYLYSSDSDKKKTSLIKMKKIMSNVDINSQKDFEKLQNMMIRYLLRNIYFFECSRRKNDSNLVLQTREVEVPSMVGCNSTLLNSFGLVINSKDYQNILKTLSESSNRRGEVTSILKYYK